MEILVNGKILKNNELYDYEFFKNKYPIITYKKEKDALYTTLIIDRDSPSKETSNNKYRIHLFKINNDEIILNYEPPNPPINSGEHRYYVYILKQEKYYKYNNNDRSQFDYNEFFTKYNLKKAYEMCFKAIRK